MSRNRLGVALLVLWSVVAPAGATSYVMTTDSELLERAELVVLGRIVGVDPAPGHRLPATDYTLEVERPIAGFAPASTILVRVPGGVGVDGVGLHVFGVPRFRVGDSVLVFLTGAEGGAYRLVELGLGAFRIQEGRVGDEAARDRRAERDLGAVHTFSLAGDALATERLRSHQPRDPERFADWLADRARGVERSADYFLAAAPDPGVVGLAQPYTLITSSAADCGTNGGNPARWRQFDDGGSVGYLAHQDGQPGVAGGGFSQLRAAMAAWNRDPKSRILLTYDGNTSNTNGAVSSDGVNLIVFEDKRSEIPGSYTGGGGTLAVGSFFFNCLLFPFRNGLAHPILEGSVVIQDGAGDNYFGRISRPDLALAELLTHELGHTLGIGHSCGDGSSPSCSGRRALDRATMRASIHNDNRGAAIFPDDVAAIEFLYGVASSEPEPLVPAAPADLLVAALSTSELSLSWSDRSSNEEGFEVEEREFGADWRQIAVLPANTTGAIVGGLSEAAYRSYRVRAVNDSGASPYSPEASATTLAEAGAPCVEDGETLCLNGDRFRLRVQFRTDQNPAGACQAVELSDDTGLCWFFQPENIELVVKALDGCAVNDRFWVFAGGLTNVELELTVTDTESGAAKTYLNPPGTPFRPVQDIDAFTGCPDV